MKKKLLLAFITFVALTGCKKDSTASFTTSKTNYYLNEPVSVSNNSTNASSYKWDFGDGGSSTEKNPQHAYNKNGVYQIKLTANGSATSVQSIRVFPGSASYEVDNTTSTAVPLVSFAVDANNELFDFKDHGTIAAGGRSDTVFTFNSSIHLGGTIGSKIFLAVDPYTINQNEHNKIALKATTQIYIKDAAIGKQAIQSLLFNKSNRQVLNSVR